MKTETRFLNAGIEDITSVLLSINNALNNINNTLNALINQNIYKDSNVSISKENGKE